MGDMADHLAWAAPDNEPACFLRVSDHTYWCGKTPLLGVGQILEINGLKVHWKDAPESMQFGSDVHFATQLDDEGNLDEESVSSEIMGCIQGWRQFKKDFQVVIEQREQPVFRPDLGAAGTPDAIITMTYQKARVSAIPDIKTGSSGLQPWWAWQTAVYAVLLDTVASKRLVVHLEANGRYKIHWFNDILGDRAVFQAALLIARVKQEIEKGKGNQDGSKRKKE